MLGWTGHWGRTVVARVSQSLEDIINAGLGSQDAVDLGAGIYMSRGIANAYLVTTSEGDVLINTGLPSEAPEIRARFSHASANPLRVIVFTQGHPDHVGGWSQLTGPGVETIAQANHTDVREYWRRLHPFYAGRIARLWGLIRPDDLAAGLPPEADVTTTFIDSHTFTLGGRRIELYAVPGGEATDSLVVWMPGERTVFVGNLLGPVFGHVPNLYTIRGDKIRSAQTFLHGVDRVMALEPEILITGHDRFEGAEEITRTLRKIREATAYLRDSTIEGMNAGRSVWELMETITLPDDLLLPQLHGKVSWIVRAVFEEHTGWFRYESTTELYALPPSVVWADLVELAGGADRLVERAREHVDADRPLEALHLVDMVRAEADLSAREVKRDALQLLLDRSGNENFSEVRWLQQEISAIGQTGDR
jgi:alkyl sulfatase BDS1-like metallo-beta-lactamase superfamily hydrolase